MYKTDTRTGTVSSNLAGDLVLVPISAAAHFTISSATNTNCTLSFATVDAQCYTRMRIEAGYDACPSADGLISIQTYAGVTLWALPITSPGPAPLPSLDDILMTVSTGVKVVMKGAYGGKGYLNARPKLE